MSRNLPHRTGYSFFELIGSLAAATALVIGMACTMGVALKASSTNTTPASNTLAGMNTLNEIAGELMYANSLTEKAAMAITATIPDRNDADASRDTVRYFWSGTPGQPITRSYNGGAAVTAVANVYDFSVRYSSATSPVELLFIRIQVSADSRGAVETTIPLLNRP